jgi:hypothetical protein
MQEVHPDTYEFMYDCLTDLRDELAKLGVKSEVDELSVYPRLRVRSAIELATPSSEFENSVVVMWNLWYAWPWGEMIERLENVPAAAAEIAKTHAV